jgi:N6-adenosine-specific RNA methylase IME4
MIQELRLGNYYKKIVNGVAVDNKQLTIEDIVEYHTNGNVYFEPIRITDARLTKMGFTSDQLTWTKTAANGKKVVLGNYKPGYYLMSGNTAQIQVQFMHHIQNVYFGHTGEEVITL